MDARSRTADLDAWARNGPAVAAPAPDHAAEPTALVVTVDTGERIHYLDWGDPTRTGSRALAPLVLVHGLAQTAWSWTPIARRLRAATRVLAVDLRGHGVSDAPRSGYDLKSVAYDVLTVAVAAGLGNDARLPPLVIAGHGFGAMVAATAASLRRVPIGGLALVDGGWEEIAESSATTPAEVLRTLGDPPEVLSSMSAFLADRRDWDPQTWDVDQERAARATVDAKVPGHVAPVTRPHVLRASVEAMFEYRPLETLVALDVPLLVAVAEAGTADDEDARERALALQDVLARREAAAAPPGRVVRFAGVGHNLMRYRADALSAELLALVEMVANTPDGVRETE